MPLPLRIMHAEVSIVSVMVARLGRSRRRQLNKYIKFEHGNMFIAEVRSISCNIVSDCGCYSNKIFCLYMISWIIISATRTTTTTTTSTSTSTSTPSTTGKFIFRYIIGLSYISNRNIQSQSLIISIFSAWIDLVWWKNRKSKF